MPWPKTRRPRSGGVYTSHATDFNSYILFRRTFCFYEFTKFSYESGERKLNGMKKNRTTSSSNRYKGIPIRIPIRRCVKCIKLRGTKQVQTQQRSSVRLQYRNLFPGNNSPNTFSLVHETFVPFPRKLPHSPHIVSP